MSNDYVQFSFAFPLHNKEELDWWANALTFSMEDMEEIDRDEAPETSYSKVFREVTCEDLEWNFEHDIVENSILFFSQDYGDPYQIARLIHAFYKDLRPDTQEIFYISWAEVNDALKTDCYGGGVYAVSTKGIGMCEYEQQCDYARMDIQSLEN
jgi:hypothetical protein